MTKIREKVLARQHKQRASSDEIFIQLNEYLVHFYAAPIRQQ
jgi:hypothetical protein